MTAPYSDPPMPRLLLFVTGIAFIVVVNLGVSLFFLTESTRPIWRWEITPFNALFLGSVYLAAVPLLGILLVVRRSSLARLVLPMITIFATILLIISLVYRARFRFDHWATWFWFGLYVVLPLSGAYYLWRDRRTLAAAHRPVSARLTIAMGLESAILGLYGIALLVLPATATAFWPWPIDAFHAQLYSAIFFSLALGALIVAAGTTRRARMTFGLAQAVLGLFAVAGVVKGDLALDRINWAAAGTWGWMAAFAGIALAGLGLIWESREQGRQIMHGEVAYD
jgi:hypothetical protein